MTRYKFSEPPETSNKSSKLCPTCGYRRNDARHVKVMGKWLCDLVQLDNGHWIHANRVVEYEMQGHRVVHRLLEDAI